MKRSKPSPNAPGSTRRRSLVASRQRARSKLIALLADDYRRILERDEHERTARRPREPTGEALRRLERREISLAQYLDAKVEQAMERVRGLLPDDDFDHLRAVIRERVDTDPLLVALAQRLVSGAEPPKSMS